MSEVVIKTESITKIFGGIQALNDVSIEVNKGEILGLIGPNGAGKTTLFNIISGYYPPTDGEIYFKGEKITKKNIQKIVKLGIARTFQLVQVFPEMTVLENVMVGAMYGRKEVVSYDLAVEDSLKALEIIGMKNYAYKLMKSLVLTERKKTELARVLTTNPEVILLDEIIAGLNPSETDEMLAIINKINKELGLTIVFVEHVMKAVMSICHRIIVLNSGQLIAEGTPKEISQNAEVIKAYLGTEVVDKYVEDK